MYLMKVNKLTTRVTIQRWRLLQFRGFSGSSEPSHPMMVTSESLGVGEEEVGVEFSLNEELSELLVTCFSKSCRAVSSSAVELSEPLDSCFSRSRREESGRERSVSEKLLVNRRKKESSNGNLPVEHERVGEGEVFMDWFMFVCYEKQTEFLKIAERRGSTFHNF
jgi:hypothetical protein